MPGKTPRGELPQQIRQSPELLEHGTRTPAALQRGSCAPCTSQLAACHDQHFFATICSLRPPRTAMPSAVRAARASSSFFAVVVIATSRPRIW